MTKTLSWLIFLIFFTGSAAIAEQVPRMDKDELKSKLGSKDLVILDVRQTHDWNASRFKIKSAVRVENGDLSIAKHYPRDSTFVLYCA